MHRSTLQRAQTESQFSAHAGAFGLYTPATRVTFFGRYERE
jgi:hypothetical protein